MIEIEQSSGVRSIKCHSCGDLADCAIRHFGWRSFWQYYCTTCKSNYLVDLPIFAGIAQPAVYRDFNLVSDNKPTWWNFVLFEDHKFDYQIVTSKNAIASKPEVITYYNCLDIVYGHAVNRFLTAHHDHKDINRKNASLFILPKSLSYFSRLILDDPDTTVLLVDGSFKDFQKLSANFDFIIKKITKGYKKVRMYPHPYPTSQNSSGGLKSPQNTLGNIKKIVFVYRKDRTWGRFRLSQYLKLCFLAYFVRNKLKIPFFVIGERDGFRLPWTSDQRSTGYSMLDDASQVDICVDAILIGVHGSHLLLPSLKASYVVELTPLQKLYNFSQATIIPSSMTATDAVLRLRYVYGNSSLSNVNARTVYELVRSLTVNIQPLRRMIAKEKIGDFSAVREIAKTRNKFNQLG